MNGFNPLMDGLGIHGKRIQLKLPVWSSIGLAGAAMAGRAVRRPATPGCGFPRRARGFSHRAALLRD